jgi:hypothetical protein
MWWRRGSASISPARRYYRCAQCRDHVPVVLYAAVRTGDHFAGRHSHAASLTEDAIKTSAGALRKIRHA